MMCIQGLLIIDAMGVLPKAPSADLWKRVWPWLEFFDTYRDYLPHLLRPKLEISAFSPVLLQLINGLRKDENTATLMLATPGFRTVIFRLWARSFDQTEHAAVRKAISDMLCMVMHNFPLSITNDRSFEEAIDGSGGSRPALARLCINHVKLVVQSAVNSPGDYSMHTVMLLLQKRCEVDESFRQLLVDEGIVSALTSVACRFSSPSFAKNDSFFNLCWAVKYYFRMPFGHKTITEALGAGLLRALLTVGRMSPPPDPRHLEQLDEILIFFSSSSVYLSFLLQLRASIKELKIPIDGHTFHGFSLSDKWECMWSILQSRWDFMETYLRREKTTAMASCSNMTCHTIARRFEFKRCSACRFCRYCRKACQAYDWEHGGHRELCGWDCGVPDGVGRRDRSFMRALLHYDYSRLKRSILTDELAFLRSNPGTPFYVQFDYCTPSVTSTVQISVEAVSSFALDSEMWRYQIARVEESGGRLGMHVMRIADGGCDSISLHPLSSATGSLMTGLESLADDTTVGEQADRLEIQRLAELDILEVYG
ncbi:hypothetical protein C8R45DRAFT_619020 [Mycena sanguinolenta]|nr:hypothetical protein C8R45DRAFT_619020 [Mycena sanguinolenta]